MPATTSSDLTDDTAIPARLRAVIGSACTFKAKDGHQASGFRQALFSDQSAHAERRIIGKLRHHQAQTNDVTSASHSFGVCAPSKRAIRA